MRNKKTQEKLFCSLKREFQNKGSHTMVKIIQMLVWCVYLRVYIRVCVCVHKETTGLRFTQKRKEKSQKQKLVSKQQTQTYVCNFIKRECPVKWNVRVCCTKRVFAWI